MSEGALSPRETGRLIAETSKDVTVDSEGVKKVAGLIVEHARGKSYRMDRWQDHELNPTTMDKAAVDWIFVSDVLNFSFWSPDRNKKYTLKYKDIEYTGYWTLCAAMNRAIDIKLAPNARGSMGFVPCLFGKGKIKLLYLMAEGIAITDPNYYASVSKEELRRIFRSNSEIEIPLLDERHQVLTDAGKILVKKYNGSFSNCIKACDNSAQKLLQLLVREFPSLRDEADYNGKKVSFYKRAQILIADVWSSCEGKGLGEFNDIDSITMFADYRIPQVLAHYGALKYSSSLTEKLEKDNLLENGERLEMEIRGCSIWATELISEEVKKLLEADPDLKGTQSNSIMVDHYLWDHRREHELLMESTPYHKTRSIYY